MSYVPLGSEIETGSLIVRWPVAVPKKPFVIVAEWIFLIVAVMVSGAYLWAVAHGLE